MGDKVKYHYKNYIHFINTDLKKYSSKITEYRGKDGYDLPHIDKHSHYAFTAITIGVARLIYYCAKFLTYDICMSNAKMWNHVYDYGKKLGLPIVKYEDYIIDTVYDDRKLDTSKFYHSVVFSCVTSADIDLISAIKAHIIILLLSSNAEHDYKIFNIYCERLFIYGPLLKKIKVETHGILQYCATDTSDYTGFYLNLSNWKSYYEAHVYLNSKNHFTVMRCGAINYCMDDLVKYSKTVIETIHGNMIVNPPTSLYITQKYIHARYLHKNMFKYYIPVRNSHTIITSSEMAEFHKAADIDRIYTKYMCNEYITAIRNWLLHGNIEYLL